VAYNRSTGNMDLKGTYDPKSNKVSNPSFGMLRFTTLVILRRSSTKAKLRFYSAVTPTDRTQVKLRSIGAGAVGVSIALAALGCLFAVRSVVAARPLLLTCMLRSCRSTI
jgi:hypothetical protein